MPITNKDVAQKIGEYFQGAITLGQLVDWAETALMEEEFDEQQVETLRSVVARLGLADVRAFGLTWEDCQDLLRQLGYTAHVEIVGA